MQQRILPSPLQRLFEKPSRAILCLKRLTFEVVAGRRVLECICQESAQIVRHPVCLNILGYVHVSRQ